MKKEFFFYFKYFFVLKGLRAFLFQKSILSTVGFCGLLADGKNLQKTNLEVNLNK